MRPVVPLLLLFTALGCSPRDRPEVRPPGPGERVLLLTVDTMRADSLPCLGHVRDTTPNLCALAARGRLYERAYSPAPATHPALASVLTGSIVANEDPVDLIAHYDQQRYLAQDLADRGLLTAAFTDHHGLGGQELRPVFASSNLHRGFQTFENFGVDRNSKGAAQVTEAASAWLQEHAHQPHLLWVHYFDPHFNYRADPELAARFGFDAAGCGRVHNAIDIDEIRKIQSEATPEELACLVALHEAELYATDQAIGRLLAAHTAAGLADDGLIIMFADHGEEFLERGRVGHEWTLYDELIRVPFMVVGPGIAPGRESRPISTVAARDFALGREVEPPATVFSRTHHFYGKVEHVSEVRSKPNEFAAISGDAKVIQNPDGTEELYDLRRDPGERTDRVPLGETSGLSGTLSAWRVDNLVTPGAPSAEALSREAAKRERLRSLGYVE